MITFIQLRSLARARIKDGDVLYRNRRYDGSYYLCGYSIELYLKSRIIKTLKWDNFPSTRSEFKNLTSFKTHNLEVLLHLSGKEKFITLNYMPE